MASVKNIYEKRSKHKNCKFFRFSLWELFSPRGQFYFKCNLKNPLWTMLNKTRANTQQKKSEHFIAKDFY